MYVRNGITASAVLREIWPVALITALWSTAVLLIHELGGVRVFTVPLTPVTTVGIVVSLYLGFKTTSAYQRWWEARTLWGGIINDSRAWGFYVLSMIDPVADDPDVARRLIRRQMAWVNALAAHLRRTSRLSDRRGTLFSRRIDDVGTRQERLRAAVAANLGARDQGALKDAVNVPAQLMRLQGEDLRALFDKGAIDANRFVALSDVLRELTRHHGGCERIKNTPFPQQISLLGRIITYVFIALMPLALDGAFETIVKEYSASGWLAGYVVALVPFSVLIACVFFLMEKVSESCEDPFEWAPTDVPVCAMVRTIEIDLLQMLEEKDLPRPVTAEDGVLY